MFPVEDVPVVPVVPVPVVDPVDVPVVVPPFCAGNRIAASVALTRIMEIRELRMI
jgi:hypothetical protein